MTFVDDGVMLHYQKVGHACCDGLTHVAFGNILLNHHEVYYEVNGFCVKAYYIATVLLPQPCTEAPEMMRQDKLSLRYFLIEPES